MNMANTEHKAITAPWQEAGGHYLAAWLTAGLALLLWYVAFGLEWSNFWIKIALSASLLAGIACKLEPLKPAQYRIDGRALLLGALSAVALYFIFWLSKILAVQVLPFADGQVAAIYGKGENVPRVAVFFLLLLVTGPAEEIYWRGFLQRNLMRRHGPVAGWLLATVVYAGVHVWSMNLMLVGAAAVAGAFWGWLYLRWGRLAPVIVSHALWSAFIFAVTPVP